jgi:hypothetical protein
MYAVILKELEAVMKVIVQARQSNAVNKTSVESTAQDDFLEIWICKGHISMKPRRQPRIRLHSKIRSCQPASKTVLTSNFFASLRTTVMDTDTTGEENTGKGGF